MNLIEAKPLTSEAFAPFGQLIDKQHGEKITINNGNCLRHHDLAAVELGGDNAKPLISIFEGQAYALPHKLDMVERHPLGSQAFMPMHDRPFLVCVCEDENGKPVRPQAFVTAPNQGFNLKQNTWHGVLTPIGQAGDFLVVDRGGDGNNLEEHYFEAPFFVEVSADLI